MRISQLELSKLNDDEAITQPMVVEGNNGGSINYPEIEPDDVVVTARYRVAPESLGGGLSFTTIKYGSSFGPGTPNADPFAAIPAAAVPLTSARELVAKACESLAIAIKAATDSARWLLPEAEERRLDKLSMALSATATGLKLGNLDLATAKTTIQSTLATAFDIGGGAFMAVAFEGLGAWATTLMPSPVMKAMGIAGFAAAGLAMDWYISDTGLANSFATLLTNGLFNGAQALASTIEGVMQKLHDGINIFTNQFMPHHEISQFQLESNGTYGNFDGTTANGTELYVGVSHSGLGTDYVFTTNARLVVPRIWNYGDPVVLPSDGNPSHSLDGELSSFQVQERSDLGAMLRPDTALRYSAIEELPSL